MAQAILIREARRDDWPQIERLVRAAWHEDYFATGETYLGIEQREEKLAYLKEEYDSFGSRFVVAEDGGRVVGLAIAHARADRVWLDDLLVDPQARRQGIARELVKQCVSPEADVLCEVNARNAPGLAFFRELGFEKVVETVVLKRPPQG